ncbi:MAG: trigger factor [Deltaproteobacteria bacterium]|nr:trigger factor [Deltaproteobacteria bacterium]
MSSDAQVTIEEISSVKRKLSFEIDWDDVKRELDNAYRTVGKSARIKGFRPGKTPRRILEMHYRDEAEGEAISSLVQKHYTEALQENNILAVDQPSIEQKGIEQEKNFSFSATVEVQPEHEPKDYTGVEVQKQKLSVTDEDVAKRLDQIREMYTTLEEVMEDRGAGHGDYVLIDFQVTVDGVVRDELTSKGYMLEIGAGRLIPGFENKLIGMKKNETKEDTIMIPEDFVTKEIAGKEASFTVTVKDIRQKVVPELDESFIKNFEKYKTIDELRDDLRKSLEEEGKARIESQLKNSLMDELLKKNEFDVPSIWVEQQIRYMMIDVQRRMVSNGMPPEKAAELSYNLRDSFKDQALKIVKSSFLIERIAEKETITVEDSDRDEKIRAMAERYGQDYETVKGFYAGDDMRSRLDQELMEEKTFAFLERNARIEEVDRIAEQGGGEVNDTDTDGN